jgi:hypothetical protein
MAHVASYIVLVHEAEQRVADGLDQVGRHHATESEILHGSRTLADLSRQNLRALDPIRTRYQQHRDDHAHHEPANFFAEPVAEAREGPIGMLRDLQDLLTLVAFAGSGWTVVLQGAKAMKDEDLKGVCDESMKRNEQQARWLRTQIKNVAPQALVLAQ